MMESGSLLLLIPKKVMQLQLQYDKLTSHLHSLSAVIPHIRAAWLSIEKGTVYYGTLTELLSKMELDEVNSTKELTKTEMDMFSILEDYANVLGERYGK